MYKIIGTDRKEYGPIDPERLRQWITEARLHAQCLVKAEGGQWLPLHLFPEFAALAPAAPAPLNARPAPASNDGLATLIPFRNPRALVAYYLGLFSLFPALGFFLGLTAVILGVQGLRIARQQPEAKGKAHAWVGIICGSLFGLFNLLLLVGIILGLSSHRHRGGS